MVHDTMDTILSDIWNEVGQDVPEAIKDSKIFEDIYLLYNLVVHLNSFKTVQQKKTTVSPFLSELLNYFEGKIKNTYKFKWYMLSAHDTTI